MPAYKLLPVHGDGRLLDRPGWSRDLHRRGLWRVAW